MLLPVFEYVSIKHYSASYECKDGFIDHRGLLNILKDGQPDDFRIGMRKHLAPHFERVSTKKD